MQFPFVGGCYSDNHYHLTAPHPGARHNVCNNIVLGQEQPTERSKASPNDSQFKLKQLHAENGQLLNCVIRGIAAEDVVHHSRHWYMGPNSFSSWRPVYNWNPMHDCDVTCLPLCFTVCDFMIYMAGICMNPNNGMLNFQEPAIQNLRIQDLKKFSQHFMFLLLLLLPKFVFTQKIR